MDGDILWTPPGDARERTKMGRLMTRVQQHHGVRFADYQDFWRWSVDNLEDFYAELAEFSDVRFTDPPATVLTSRVVPDARWFPGGTLNFAEHVFRALPPGIVVTGVSELRDNTLWTAEDLRAEVGRIRAGLVRLGVQRGDPVAGYLPHIPETLAAFLAVASLGAVWAVCPPEFGVHSVVDRLGQVEPKVLLAVDGYRFGGRDFDRRAEAEMIRSELPSVETLVWLPYLNTSAPPAGAVPWDEAFGTDAPVEFAQVPFDHTLYVLYTSGTTALPKAIPHSHGGPLLEHHKWLGIQADMGPGDTFFWFSTTGWIVWNLAVSALLTGASVVTYDGSPIYPDLRRQWQLVEELKITHLGAFDGLPDGLHAGGPETRCRIRPVKPPGGAGRRLAVSGRRLGVGLRRRQTRHARGLLVRWDRRGGHLHRGRSAGASQVRPACLRVPGGGCAGLG